MALEREVAVRIERERDRLRRVTVELHRVRASFRIEREHLGVGGESAGLVREKRHRETELGQRG